MPTTNPTIVPIQKIGPAEDRSAWKARSNASSSGLLNTRNSPGSAARSACSHGGEIGARLQLDDPELDRDVPQMIRVAGQQRGEGALAHHHGAVGHEIGAERIAADDPHRAGR